MFLETHAILRLVDHTLNVGILMVLLLVLVCQIILDLLQIVVQNVQLIQNVQVTKHVWMKNVAILVQAHVAWTLNAKL